ncbi:MAG: hypothetical protein DLM65_05940 [Candidatus Aeolococcus gillhamiae]|uniref:Uncharacterized protein n=1 Tax=Candidatus Aeolococcus gillhamiae TaxID=3127015 RepID=A0A2W5Z7J8_9BACT|nr:MAG: hypothetical protein DLM65_05940 [Candidatus Dormibacter sp. RRmetagenome_bin12]
MEPSRTLASLNWRIQHNALRLTPRHVAVLDEAAMTDDAALLGFLEAASVAGAKVVAVGDPRQLSNPHRFARTCGRQRLKVTGSGGGSRRRCQRGSRAPLCGRCRRARRPGSGPWWSRAERGGCNAAVGGRRRAAAGGRRRKRATPAGR